MPCGGGASKGRGFLFFLFFFFFQKLHCLYIVKIFIYFLYFEIPYKNSDSVFVSINFVFSFCFNFSYSISDLVFSNFCRGRKFMDEFKRNLMCVFWIFG